MRLKNVPDEIHRELKITAVREGISLNDLVIQILRREIERQPRKR